MDVIIIDSILEAFKEADQAEAGNESVFASEPSPQQDPFMEMALAGLIYQSEAIYHV